MRLAISKMLPRPQSASKLNPDSENLQELHPALQSIYRSRGVESRQELDYSLKNLPSPWLLSGMEKTVEVLTRALEERQQIVIVADFDADGATSCAVAKLGLELFGAKPVAFVIPDRFKFGYGLTPEIVEVAMQQQPQVLLTVDNGTSSIEGVAAARSHGLEVIITDHHLPGETLPEATAIVNPNLVDEQFPSGNLAGVGVMFYVLIALRTRLREQGWFEQQSIPAPNLANLLDLVALGTVADVVALDALNRTLVHQGLQRIRAGYGRPGINALLDIAGRTQANAAASDMGFAVGPRLNAAGRLEDMTLGVQCLLTEDRALAKQFAVQLDSLNHQRRAIEDDMKEDARQILEGLHQLSHLSNRKAICLYQPDWHQGVIGILASRVKESLHRPVIAFAQTDDGILKGSGRSIAGLHLRDVLVDIAALHPKLLLSFGGHAMAAGLSIHQQDFDLFTREFEFAVERRLEKDALQAILYTDGELQQGDFSFEFAELLEQSGPWGQGFPEPIFEGCFDVLSARILKEKHVKLILQLVGTSVSIDAIAFNVENAEDWLGYEQVTIAYNLQANRFMQKSTVQLMVQYLDSSDLRGSQAEVSMDVDPYAAAL